MEYVDICKYVFLQERVPWNVRELRDQHRQCSQARQICYFLGDWFYPRLKYADMAKMFAQNPSNVGPAIKAVKRVMEYDEVFAMRVGRYTNYIRSQINLINFGKTTELIKSTPEEIETHLKGFIESIEPVVRLYCEATGMQLTKKVS